MNRSVAWIAATFVVAHAAGSSAASPGSDANDCSNAFRKARERERSGRLREASALLATCARTSCGNALQHECASDFVRLDSEDIPTILPEVSDETGVVLTDVRVRMDGELLATRLDGRPIAVDPGVHEFTFETDGRVVGRQHLLILEGQRERAVAVTLHEFGDAKTSAMPASRPTIQLPASADDAPPTTDRSAAGPSPGRPSVATVLAVAGASGVVAGALLPYLDAKDRWPAPVDVSVGVGVAAVVVTLWTMAAAGPHQEQRSRAALSIDLRRTPSGALLSASRSF